MASPTRRVRISHKGGEAHTFVLYPALPVGELTELLGSVFSLQRGGGQDGNSGPVVVGLRAKEGLQGHGGVVVPLSLACRFPDQLVGEEYEVVVAADHHHTPTTTTTTTLPPLPPPITIGSGTTSGGGASEAHTGTGGGVSSRVRELCMGPFPPPLNAKDKAQDKEEREGGSLLSPQVGSVLVAGLDEGLVPQGLLSAAYTHYDTQQQQLCAFLIRLTQHLRSEEGRVLVRAQDRLLTTLAQLAHDRGGGLGLEGVVLLRGLILEEAPSLLALALPPPASPTHSDAFDPLAIRNGLLCIAKARGVGSDNSDSPDTPPPPPPSQPTATETACGREELWGAIQSLQQATPHSTNALAITPHDAQRLQWLLCEDEGGGLQGALWELRQQAGPQGLRLALHALALASRTPHTHDTADAHTPPHSPLTKGAGRQVLLLGSGPPLAPTTTAVATSSSYTNDRTTSYNSAKRECALFTPVPDELVTLLNEAVASGYLSSLQALLAVKLWGAGQAPDIVRAYTRYKRSKDGGRDLVNTVASRLRAVAKASASVGPEGSAAATDGGSQRGDYDNEEDEDEPTPQTPHTLHEEEGQRGALALSLSSGGGGKGAATGAGVRKGGQAAVAEEEGEEREEREGEQGVGGGEGSKPRCQSSSLLSLSSSSASSGSERGDNDNENDAQDLDQSQVGASQSTHLSSLPPHEGEEGAVLSEGERDALTHLTHFLHKAGELEGWEWERVRACLLDPAHPQHAYLARLYRHSSSHTGRERERGLDWLAAHLKALAQDKDTRTGGGGAAQPPPDDNNPGEGVVVSPSLSSGSVQLCHRLEVLQRLTQLHVLPQAAYTHFKHGLESGDPEVEAFFDSYEFPKGDMACLAQGLEDACARLQATHGNTKSSGGGGGCCHDHPPHNTTAPQVSSRQWTLHRVELCERLASLQILPTHLAAHAKQLLLEGDPSVHDLFDKFETQGDQKGLLDSLETLLDEHPTSPPQAPPQEPAADTHSGASGGGGGANNTPPTPSPSVGSVEGEGEGEGLGLLLPIISQLHLTPAHTQALRHAIAQHDPAILRALKEFKRTRDPQHLSQRLAELVHSLPTPHT